MYISTHRRHKYDFCCLIGHADTWLFVMHQCRHFHVTLNTTGEWKQSRLALSIYTYIRRFERNVAAAAAYCYHCYCIPFPLWWSITLYNTNWNTHNTLLLTACFYKNQVLSFKYILLILCVGLSVVTGYTNIRVRWARLQYIIYICNALKTTGLKCSLV